jgi:hypothetical protein
VPESHFTPSATSPHGLGLVSHGFLRRYAWTLDFQRMTMTFALPD